MQVLFDRGFLFVRMAFLHLVLVVTLLTSPTVATFVEQPLARIAIHRSVVKLDSKVTITASPDVLGVEGEGAEYVTVEFKRHSGAENSDWIGVFSPANFNASICSETPGVPNKDQEPLLCSAPVKYSYANFSTPDYAIKGEGRIKFRLINMRADYSFGFFKGDITSPVLLAVSNAVKFSNPKAPGYLRLASGNEWNEITVTWTSGYGSDEGIPFVQWGIEEDIDRLITVADTDTFTQNDMCGAPASTVGWRDPGFIHTASLRGLQPNLKYYYRVGHELADETYDWGRPSLFKAPPYPGEDCLQQVVVFGDMGKAERDGSNEFSNYQLASLNTTDTLAEDLDNYDIIFHIGDLAYANGYIAQWDQFIEQVEVLSSRVPYMTVSGNHERDWPFSGSFYNASDSGGECGVPAQTLFNMPAKNRAKYWYSTDWGMFHFCIANTEEDWRNGTDQYKFLEECFASADREKHPWLIFLAHRVLGYSSGKSYAKTGTFNELGGREDLQTLWQKYKVDLAFYGHVHNYERTCPIYESSCVSQEREHYSGEFNATINIVAGGGGAGLEEFVPFDTTWSYFKDYDYGFTKLTAFNRSRLLVEYKKSSNGQVYDKFWFTRTYNSLVLHSDQ